MVTAVAITWTLITCCYRPFGRPFKVTDKGGNRSRTVVRWEALRVFGAFMTLSLGAIAWALFGPCAPTESTPVDTLNLVWAAIAASLSGVACLVCIERPRSHREELFETRRAGRLAFGAAALSCVVDRLSTVDASVRLHVQPQSLSPGSAVRLSIRGMTELHGEVADRRGRSLTISFAVSEQQRRELVVALYRAPNDNLPLQAAMGRSLVGVLRRGFGRD